MDGEQETAAAAAAQWDAEEEDEYVDQKLLAAAIALSLAQPDEEDEQQEEQLPPPPPLKKFLEARTPESLLCPITLHLFDDPVVLVADGCTYSRAAIEEHLAFCRQSKWGWTDRCVYLYVPHNGLID